MGNVELFELCEAIPKVQCPQCLLYWNQGVIYCTCGHFLVESESRRKFHKLRLDALSVPHYVFKKGRCHGARHGNQVYRESQLQIGWTEQMCIEIDELAKQNHTYRRPRDLLDPASMNPEQLTSTPTKQDLLDEEILAMDLLHEAIQKFAMKTHLEVQQREDIRRDLAERMKFCSSWPSCKRTGMKIRAKSRKDGNPADGWRW